MKRVIDSYLILLISINMLMALTIVCAPESSMMAIENLLANPEEITTENNLKVSEEGKQIQILGQATGTIEFNR